ncbi:hypothetical protein LTR16_011492, partial [Cryomyces antarcticus]
PTQPQLHNLHPRPHPPSSRRPVPNPARHSRPHAARPHPRRRAARPALGHQVPHRRRLRLQSLDPSAAHRRRHRLRHGVVQIQPIAQRRGRREGKARRRRAARARRRLALAAGARDVVDGRRGLLRDWLAVGCGAGDDWCGQPLRGGADGRGGGRERWRRRRRGVGGRRC